MGDQSTSLFIFFLLSLGIVYLCRNDIRNRGSYGYYRFFSFEFVLLLIVSSAPVWFVNPFSPLQMLSWLSLAVSLYLGFSGLKSLIRRREACQEASGELVETGLHRKIRHPLYSALLFFSLGAFLKQPSVFWAILVFGVFFTLMSTVRAEEELDEKKFGPRYAEYKGRTKMFVPYIF